MEIYIDENGYLRDEDDKLVHRTIAYNEIYLENEEEYDEPFSEYIVHHIDGDKLNNDVSNLSLMIKESHDDLHGIVNPSPIRSDYHPIHIQSSEWSNPMDSIKIIVSIIFIVALLITIFI